MIVESVTVSQEGQWGCVMGRLRVGRSIYEGFETTFCGVWKFDMMGRAVEHWENAGDAAGLVRWLRERERVGEGVKGERE